MTTPSRPSRRSLLRAGAGTLGLGGAAALAGCGGTSAAVPSGDGWRRFAGTTITFCSENSAPTAAIAADLSPFRELTGIDVKIATYDVTSLAQVVALDFASGSAQYDVVYADPWMIMAPMAKGMTDLREFLGDDTYPQPEGGLDDFVPLMMQVEGRFDDPEAVLTLPYDAPTLLLHYREDLFEQYGDAMAADLGFDPTPGGDLTWEQLALVGQWFNDNVEEVDYGLGMMAKQHDALSSDFTNVLLAYGGEFFDDDERVGLVGSTDPGRSLLGSDAAQEAAAMYKELVRVAHPSSVSWDWDGTGAALRAGQIAMCCNWHENAAANEAALPGKIGYATLPKGPVRSANCFGGTGIGINNASQGARRDAAWLFLVWATSPDVQAAGLASSVGGGTPTRTSVYQRPEVLAASHRPSKYPNMLSYEAVSKTWELENAGLRPKIPMWQETLVTYYTGLSHMIVDDLSPAAAMAGIARSVDEVVARGWSA